MVQDPLKAALPWLWVTHIKMIGSGICMTR
ncbi:Uncharacterised protein [Vibrio cholerae]|nr:Uncharacterised protein [Vibrio cholerae]